MDNDRLQAIRKLAKIELAKREFFYYCNLMASSFYKEDRGYLINICNELQEFYSSEDDVMIINLPPRHGKSFTATLFTQWLLGRDKDLKIMTGSYNETLSTTFSRGVRNAIQEQKADEDRVVFSDIFPDTKIKKGEASINLWSLEGAYNNYLATSPGGTATGFGCKLMIIDDLIKNAEEAFNENTLEGHWNWFTNTMLSRLEEGGKIIIIMTRWASGDLAGKASEHFRGMKCRELIMKAVQDDNSMLCDEVLSRKSYDMKVKAMGEEIASANYQQVPIDMKGALYQSFKTYTELPVDDKGNLLFVNTIAYCDTADEGSDYLCNIIVGEYLQQGYVLDIYYTKDGMEITEEETAKRLYENKVNIAHVESNSGGRGFARNVKRILSEVFKSSFTTVRWFHQSKNKKARILSNATWIMNNLYFPINWRDRFPKYYSAMVKYQKEGKNKNDDAPDASTGIAEKLGSSGTKTVQVRF
jgi:predicted phage terminase large subunit-like protein